MPKVGIEPTHLSVLGHSANLLEIVARAWDSSARILLA
jgi:hypothetical protein